MGILPTAAAAPLVIEFLRTEIEISAFVPKFT